MNEIEQTGFWKVHAKERKERGLSRAAYCRTKNLTENRLFYWERKFLGLGRKKKPAETKAGNFVPLAIRAEEVISEPVRVRLVSE